MEDIRPIDIMNYPFWNPNTWCAREFHILGATMMRSHVHPGSEHPKNILLETLKRPPEALPVATPTPAEYVAQMDELGYDRILYLGLRCGPTGIRS